MEILFCLVCGVFLSAACGFRIFIPFLLVNMASHAGFIDLPPGFEWIGTAETWSFFTTATVIEIIGSFIPLVDSGLKLLATPVAIVAGIIIMASFVTEMSPHVNPLLRWTLTLTVGGVVAGSTHIFSSSTRVASTATTGWLANPLISTIEPIASIASSVLGIAVSIVGVILL
jgi:hypothetical protein